MSDQKERVFPKGVFAFKPNEKAPSFVKGSVVITLEDLREFVNGDGKKYLTDYNGKKQLKLQITENKSDGKYSVTVDTFVPNSDNVAKNQEKAKAEYSKTNKYAPQEPFNGNSKDSFDLPF